MDWCFPDSLVLGGVMDDGEEGGKNLSNKKPQFKPVTT